MDNFHVKLMFDLHGQGQQNLCPAQKSILKLIKLQSLVGKCYKIRIIWPGSSRILDIFVLHKEKVTVFSKDLTFFINTCQPNFTILLL